MKVKKIKIHGDDKKKRIIVKAKKLHAKSRYAGLKKQLVSSYPSSREYNPRDNGLYSGVYRSAKDTDDRIKAYNEELRRGGAPKITVTNKDFDYLEQKHIVLTDRSEQLSLDRERQFNAKKKKAASDLAEALLTVFAGGSGRRIILTTAKLSKKNKSRRRRITRHRRN